ncbi:MAG TPA: RHS repeat-associated core domain-containing protein [Terriglobales bacterium]|jgi:RHS repeat-associated protein|nr:RHS repeat-associated core domain-containing protein [Terriglobales bacterium]
MTRAQSYLFVLLFAALAALPSAAQVTTGTPPFVSTGGGPDVINLANLNAHLNVPIFNKAGRGLPFTFYLTYDSSIWTPLISGSTRAWQPAPGFGWNGTELNIGFVSYSTTQSNTIIICPVTHLQGDTQKTTIVWTYYDGFGTPHRFPTPSTYTIAGCTGTQTSTTGGGTALDGSGYKLTVTGWTINSLVTADGNSITAPLNSNIGVGTIQDRNGNQISLSSSGVFTDTLGTTALTMSTGAPSASTPSTYTYTAPSGAAATYTVNYSNYTVATNFGASGIGEYKSSAAVPLVSSIVLPDSSRYSFTYEVTPSTPTSGACTPYSGTTCTTARIASVTLPTGGTITYSYSGGSNGILPDGSTATLTRATPDTTGGSPWTYAQVKGTAPASTTTITDPQSNQTVIQFQGIYETERQVYQGSTSATLLRTSYTCYNASTSPCNGTAITPPITQRNVIRQLPGTSNLQSEHIYKYNSYGSLTEQDDYDYGSGAPGTQLKKTAITYASLGNNIVNFPQQVTVTNGGGTTVSQTNYAYDQGTPTSTSGTPQHASVSGSRGNLTTTNYYTQGSTYLTKAITYFDTGRVQTVTDVNSAQTTYTYGACGNSFPTSVSEPLSLSRSMTWNCTGGVTLTVTDENNQTTTTAYTDPYFWRPASVTDPTTAVTNMTYLSNIQQEADLSFNGGSSATDVVATLDALGRPRLNQKRETPGGSNFDTAETDYDSDGRPARSTLPFVATIGQTSSTAPATTKTFDTLGRALTVSDSGGGTLTLSYSQNDVFTTRGPAPTGENTKRRQHEYDGLGHLTSVCEVTAGTAAWPGGTCAQNTSQTGYWTKYTNDALGDLTGVLQNAQSSGSTQSRSYSYDLMGRMLSETNPESGTTTYTYDTDTTCGTSNGDLVKRVDAVGNISCYSYDALHRPLTATYPSGAYSSVTPQKHFVYDSATVNSIAMTYTRARIAEAYTCFSPCTTKLTDIGFSYTVRGQPSDVYESTPNSGTYYHVNEQYWSNGAIELLSGLSSLPTFTFAPDGEGRSYQVSASSGQNPVTNTVFNAASLPTTVAYGSTDSDSYSYDPNTNRLTQYQFSVNGQSLTGALTWNANHTLSALNITDALNSADTQSCSFSHDDLTRIVSDNCGSVWSQTFSYDPFGNLNSGGSMSFQPFYSVSTNRMTTVGSFTFTYDANGNTTADPANSYSWDSAGKAVSITGVNLTYDALGRMVEQNRSGTYTQIVYAPHGGKFALMSGTTLQKAFVPLPGGGQAVYNSSGLLYCGHSDHLRNIRVGSTPSRTVLFDLAYAPFGDVYATSGPTDPAFTSQRQDTVTGLFDFPAREYSNEGRWTSPDPSGLASAHLGNPQTLNRYAYVRNNPLSMTDPEGLDADPDNSLNALPLNTLLTDMSGNLSFQVDGDDPNYMTEVTASISDNPSIPTESAPISGTLLEQECGGCYLSQMQNDPQSMAILNGANNFVEAAGYVELGAASLVTGGLGLDALLGTAETVSTVSETTSVFWTGSGAQAQATSYVAEYGGATLDMTPGGQAAAEATQGLDWSAARPVWNAASQQFAANAVGDVQVFIGETYSTNSIFFQTELPTLLTNPNIGYIIINF